MDAMLQVQVNRMLDSQEDSSYKLLQGQKVKGHKLCLMAYFSDMISAKMTKLAFWHTKGVFFSARMSKICLQACLRSLSAKIGSITYHIFFEKCKSILQI